MEQIRLPGMSGRRLVHLPRSGIPVNLNNWDESSDFQVS